MKFGYWELLLIWGFLWTVAANSTAERHEAKTVEGVQSATLFWSGTIAASVACGNKKIKSLKENGLGKKSPKERSCLKLRPTVQWTPWSSAAPCLAEQSKDRVKSSGSSCVFLLFFLTLQSFTYIILFIQPFMYVFHTGEWRAFTRTHFDKFPDSYCGIIRSIYSFSHFSTLSFFIFLLK